MKKNKKIFFGWLLLVIVWNFGVPGATPIQDVIVAIVLSLFTKTFEKYV